METVKMFVECAEQQFKTKINTHCMWHNQLNRAIREGILRLGSQQFYDFYFVSFVHCWCGLNVVMFAID
jgi:hypothetical protein